MMTLAKYKFLSFTGVVSILMGYLGLWAGAPAAVLGALWFSSPWKKPRSAESRHF